MLDSLQGWVGTVDGIFSTTNGGTTWRKDSLAVVPTGFIYAVNMLNSNTGYSCSSTGKVFKTTNGGVFWDTLSHPAGPQSLYSIELLNETTIVIFGTNGVYILSTDSGNTWIRKNTGGLTTLASTHRYDPNTQTTILYCCGQLGAVMTTSTTVLPVELSSFSATLSGKDVVLNWTTASELNNSGFEIERKSGDKDWENISFIEGRGTTTKISGYYFTDKNLSVGRHGYRLKQIDYDGTFKYSHSVEVEIGIPMTFGLSQNFPNPFNPTTVIRYELPVSGHVTLSVYNSLGEEVATLVNSIKEAGSHSITFDASKFASGIYIYKLKSGDFSTIKKMSLIK